MIYTFIINYLGDQIKKNEMSGECSTYGVEKGCKQDLVERPRCRWEDNIKIDLQEEGWEGHGLD